MVQHFHYSHFSKELKYKEKVFVTAKQYNATYSIKCCMNYKLNSLDNFHKIEKK